mgnify:CR=1 FL=1|tara:strand:- start:19 stop:453 length:435 start_codon:yes stop_codon:yes gene_type:complete
MSDVQLELSDEQREEVREMLAKFSGKPKKQVEIKDHEQLLTDPDPLESAQPGSTIEWNELTPKTRRYTFVRETRAVFVPYILDCVPITIEELNVLIENIGMDITSQNNSLTVCSVTQADPVRIFQIQLSPRGETFVIGTIRYIV